MKKLTSIFLIFIILLSALCGCQSNRESYKNEFDCNTDFQYIYNNLNFMPAPITMSPSGYYIILYNFLYFVDKESMKGILLCDKPNCMHNDRDECMAYFHVNSYTPDSNVLQYYKDNLYIMENASHNNEYYGKVLHKLSPDGASRKDVLTIKGNICQWLIHRGYLYYITSDMEMDESGAPVYNSFVIYKLPMDNLGGKADIVFDSSDKYKNIACFRNFSAYRDFLYISIVKDEASADGTFLDFFVWEYVLVNRHIEHRNKLNEQLNARILPLVFDCLDMSGSKTDYPRKLFPCHSSAFTGFLDSLSDWLKIEVKIVVSFVHKLTTLYQHNASIIFYRSDSSY